MSRIACLALVLFAAACTDDKPDDGMGSGSGSGSGSDSGTGDIQPEAGAWIYNETTPVSNTCPSSTPTGEFGGFGVTNVTAVSFRIIPNDGTAAFVCSLASSAFDCPDRAAHTEDYRPGIDAVLTVQATADGVFSSSRRATGSQQAVVSCAGTQCDLLGPNAFPCNVQVNFEVEAL